MHSLALSKIRTGLGAVSLLVVLGAGAPARAQAPQLVTFDQVVTITERGNGAGAFHYLIKPAASEPASWTTPVDYSRGTAHVHLEVLEKPSKRPTAITICFDGNLEGYGCIATSTYTDLGTYVTARVLPTATWQYNQIAWNRRRQEYHLVVKDPALGGTSGGRPASDYTPTKMRIVMTIVPQGGTYMPPAGAAGPAADAGAPAGNDAGAGPRADAGAGPAPITPADAAPAGDVAVTPPATSQDAAPTTGTPVSPPSSGTGGSGSNGSGGSGGSTRPGSSPPAAPPSTSSGSSAPSGGCSLAGGQASGGGLLLLATALLTGLARRRKRG